VNDEIDALPVKTETNQRIANRGQDRKRIAYRQVFCTINPLGPAGAVGIPDFDLCHQASIFPTTSILGLRNPMATHAPRSFA
jgi:hypothetical protein